MSSFRDLKNASGRDSKNVKKKGILPRRIFVFLWVFHKLVINYVLTSFRKGISLTFHFLARALTVERTVIGRPPSQCCQIGKLSSKYDHFDPFIHYAISNLATLSTLPPPLVASFTIRAVVEGKRRL